MSFKKYTLLKNGGVKANKDGYQAHPTICNSHIALANYINNLGIEDAVKKELLEKVDIVYDMGKRMGNKLRDYHSEFKKTGGWRENF